MPPGGIVDEMRAVYEKEGIKHYILFSDTFNASRAVVEGICDALIKDGLELQQQGRRARRRAPRQDGGSRMPLHNHWCRVGIGHHTRPSP